MSPPARSPPSPPRDVAYILRPQVRGRALRARHGARRSRRRASGRPGATGKGVASRNRQRHQHLHPTSRRTSRASSLRNFTGAARSLERHPHGRRPDRRPARAWRASRRQRRGSKGYAGSTSASRPKRTSSTQGSRRNGAALPAAHGRITWASPTEEVQRPLINLASARASRFVHTPSLQGVERAARGHVVARLRATTAAQTR